MKKISVLIGVTAFILLPSSYAQELSLLKLDSSRRTFALKNVKLKKDQTIYIYSSLMKKVIRTIWAKNTLLPLLAVCLSWSLV